jgi:hypothetical protein
VTTETATYLEHGWSLIEVERRGKIPAGKWAHAQTERASSADVALWLDAGSNLGVVTGELSGLVVVDCDNADAVARVTLEGYRPTPTVITGRGCHLYFRWPGQHVGNAVGILEGVDVRGEGGFCVVPPSVHPSGEVYRWATGLSLADLPPAECPAWLLRASETAQKGREPSEWVAAFRSQVGNGERNQRCAELAGHLLRRRVEPAIVFELMLGWNERRCRPAMREGEVRQVVKSIYQRELRRRERLG